MLRIHLNPSTSGQFSIMPPANVTIKCIASNGYKLDNYSEYQYAVSKSFRYVCLVFGIVILSTSLLYIFGRQKWVGNMLFLSLQFHYFNMAIIDKFSPMFGGISYFKILMGYNDFGVLNMFSLTKYPSLYGLSYTRDFDYNVNFMVGFQVLGLLMYVIYYIAWRRNAVNCKRYGGDLDKSFQSTKLGKFLSFFNW